MTKALLPTAAAKSTELHYLGEDGHTIRTEPNGVTVRRLVGGLLSARREFDALDEAHDERPIVPKRAATMSFWKPI